MVAAWNHHDRTIYGIKMPVPLTVRRRLSSTIRKFRFEELEASVLPSFPETSWSQIRTRLVQHHESFTVSNALRLIEDAINQKAKISDRVLKERLATLEIIEVSRHNNKKIWYTFLLGGHDGTVRNIIPNRELQSRIVEHFRVHQMEMDVRISSYDGITYVSMRDKPRGRKVSRMATIFFALFLGHEYIFCSRKNVTKEYVQVLVNSLGYNTAKKIKLMGRDLRSLMKILWTKKQGAVSCNDLFGTPELEIAEPIITNTGIDFRQNKQRREYIERCFGEEPPTLESLVVTGPKQPWVVEEIADRIPDEKLHVEWEFRSHNIAATLTKFAEQRIFTMPLPQYVTGLMKTGKNELKIREK